MSGPRILIVRTDRMGDLILSTPVIQALRCHFPQAYLGMMVRPDHRELIEGLPQLNAVFSYDKEGRHKSGWETLRFARELSRHRFETALILHSTNRVILTTWLAGIKRRIGYARRLPFLLTDSFPYVKREGAKHELEYNLDLLKALGVNSSERTLLISRNPRDDEKVGVFQAPLAVIHPGASCPSKRWPPERFAEVADRLVDQYGLRVVVVTGPEEVAIGQSVFNFMHNRVLSALGTLRVGELASLLGKSQLLISNDSGPVHLACALGIPVVAIFGRWGGGLSPTRWGPTGEKSTVLHHDVGCRPCLAHRCPIGFVCLDAVTVDEVFAAATHLAGLNKIDKTST